MHRTQIYLDEILYEQIKIKARKQNISISEYIRRVLHRDMKQSSVEGYKAGIDLSRFSGILRRDSTTNHDTD